MHYLGSVLHSIRAPWGLKPRQEGKA